MTIRRIENKSVASWERFMINKSKEGHEETYNKKRIQEQMIGIQVGKYTERNHYE